MLKIYLATIVPQMAPFVGTGRAQTMFPPSTLFLARGLVSNGVTCRSGMGRVIRKMIQRMVHLLNTLVGNACAPSSATEARPSGGKVFFCKGTVIRSSLRKNKQSLFLTYRFRALRG